MKNFIIAVTYKIEITAENKQEAITNGLLKMGCPLPPCDITAIETEPIPSLYELIQAERHNLDMDPDRHERQEPTEYDPDYPHNTDRHYRD